MNLEIFINNSKLDVSLDTEKTVGDVFTSITLECEKNNAAIIGVKVNNQIVSAEQIESVRNKSLNEISRLDFETVTQTDIKTAFAECLNKFSQLAEEIEDTSVKLQSGKDKEAASVIYAFADTVEQFCQLVSMAALFPTLFQTCRINGMNIKDFFSDFSPVLKEFEEALANKDTVMIGDLAEYEIKPRIEAICSMIRSIGI